MISESEGRQYKEVADERVAKVFIVVGDNTRKCLICGELFTRQASFEHSMTICYPPASAAN